MQIRFLLFLVKCMKYSIVQILKLYMSDGEYLQCKHKCNIYRILYSTKQLQRIPIILLIYKMK
jgi:hypothetical protein